MRALRLSKRSRRRRMARAVRRVTASDEPSFGLRPSLKMRTPALMMALGVLCWSRRNIAHPKEVLPKSSASLYLIFLFSDMLFSMRLKPWRRRFNTCYKRSKLLQK